MSIEEEKLRETVIREFAEVINRHNLEAGSNTPDYILAEFLFQGLMAFNAAMSKRTIFFTLSNTPTNNTGREI